MPHLVSNLGLSSKEVLPCSSAPWVGEMGCREVRLSQEPGISLVHRLLKGLCACQATALLVLAEAHQSLWAQTQHWVGRENMPSGICGSCGSKQGQQQAQGKAHPSPKGGLWVVLRAENSLLAAKHDLTTHTPTTPPRSWEHKLHDLVGTSSQGPSTGEGSTGQRHREEVRLMLASFRSHQRGARGAVVLPQPQPAPLSPSTGQG